MRTWSIAQVVVASGAVLALLCGAASAVMVIIAAWRLSWHDLIIAAACAGASAAFFAAALTFAGIIVSAHPERDTTHVR